MTDKPNVTPEELYAIIDEAYGRRAQRKLASDIAKGEVTVSRWLSGHTPIGETESILLRLILLMARRKLGWRKWLDEYMATREDKPKGIDELL